MKNLITTIVFLMMLTCLSFSQSNTKSQIWVTIDDLTIIPNNRVNQGLISTSVEFQNIIDMFSITSVKQILPDSRKENLLKVYELTCDCNPEELMNEIVKLNFEVNNPVMAPDYILLNTPNDYTTTFSQDYALDLIDAEGAWEVTTGDSSVTIGITDSGYDMNHSELIGTVSYIQPGLSGGNYYHGTAVATTAAGNTNNQIGKSSIGYNCNLQLRSNSYNSILASCYGGAKVINVSWYASCTPNTYIQDIIDEVYENGCIVVAAAGNGNASCYGSGNHTYPASLNHVISVTSVGPQNNHERTIGNDATTHQHNDSVDISAPGYDVALTVENGWYLTGNGTSFAAPYVSGTIGLMLSINPCLSFEEIESILKTTSLNIDSLNPNYGGQIGSGRLDANAAVNMVANFESHPFLLQIETGYSCDYSNSNGFIDITVTDEINPSTYSINWNTGDTTLNILGLQEGIYVVDVTNEMGCTVQEEVYLEIPEELSLEIEMTNISCNGMNDGVINFNISGGSGAYLSDEDILNGNNILLTGLSAGTYNVSVLDSNNCSVSSTVLFNEPTQLKAEIIATTDSLFIDINGGTPEYTQIWSNGSTDEIQAIVNNGFYEVEIYDNNGCYAYDSLSVNNQETMDLVEQDNSFQLFPNPTNNSSVLSFNIASVESVNIYSSNGQLVKTFDGVNDGSILINSLKSGVYYIHLNFTNNEQVIDKLLIID